MIKNLENLSEDYLSEDYLSEDYLSEDYFLLNNLFLELDEYIIIQGSKFLYHL